MKKGMSLPELIISITILFIVITAAFSMWFSIQRDLIIQRLDREMSDQLSTAKSQILDSVLKSIFIYPPDASIVLKDNSRFNLNINEKVSYNKLLTITPTSGGYYLNAYLTVPRNPQDTLLPNARMLLYYRKFINWTPQYTTFTLTVVETGGTRVVKVAKIINYPTNLTFTTGEGPKVIADYILNNGFTVNYYVIDITSSYTYTTYTNTITSRSINIQQVEITISAQRRYQNIYRNKEIKFKGAVFLEELPIAY